MPAVINKDFVDALNHPVLCMMRLEGRTAVSVRTLSSELALQKLFYVLRAFR